MIRLALSLLFVTTQAVAVDELVITNAQVYTVNASSPWAEALAIDEHGVVVAVGSNASVQAQYGSGIDLGGAMVLPGFHDVHLHAVEAGITAQFCLLSQFGDESDYRHELKDCADSQRNRRWVTAAGVNMANLLDTVDDPIGLIDQVIPDRPVVILDDLGHGAWGNTLAMQAAGFDKLKGNPQGGILVRYKNEALSGVVLESSAQVLLDASQPPTAENLEFARQSLTGAMRELARNGITSISDAGGYWPRGHDKVWHSVAVDGTLTVRASNALYVYPNKPIDQQIKDLVGRYSNSSDGLTRFNQVKIYVDGILSQTTGLVTVPYKTDIGLGLEKDGFAYFPKKELFRYARALSAAGFQLHFHATGDRGVRLALDAIEQADKASGPHRITHLYLIHPNDRSRFAELNVVADFQLAPSSVTRRYQTSIVELIGHRAEHLMPLASLHGSGALVTLSSDWDADELSPLKKLKTVLMRKSEGAPSLATAIEMMTINAARLLKHSHQTGSIEVGKFADLVVLDRNLFDEEPHYLDRVEVLATLLQGEPIFDPTGLFDN